jgi:DNA-binding NarL/FixJ family response regulator
MSEAARMIAVVEDDGAFRKQVVGEVRAARPGDLIRPFSTAEQFLHDTENESIDLALFDIQLPRMDGVELVRHARRRWPELPVIMLTHIATDETIFRALKAGAVAYALKEELLDLGQLIATVLAGGAVITPTIALQVLRSFRVEQDANDYNLTDRERQILETMARGIGVKDCAQILGVAENTLRNHVKNIYRKLDVRNQIEMMRKASDMGLI